MPTSEYSSKPLGLAKKSIMRIYLICYVTHLETKNPSGERILLTIIQMYFWNDYKNVVFTLSDGSDRKPSLHGLKEY